MKIAYRTDLRLSARNQERLQEVNRIIEEYAAQGYSLTLRQLYYQLVSRDMIPNKKAEYDKLGRLLVKGRMAGVVDWDAIEDRIRVPKLPYWVHNIPDALRDTVSQYRLNRQDNQDTYIEVWCEKDALSAVLYRVTKYYHIRLMVNRGYSSCTAMHDAFERFESAEAEELAILYIGDHDPSGLDMLRDIKERLQEFGTSVEVVPIALTREQIEQYDPPENPAKITDPRAGWYIEKYGDKSWEVDALPPQTLHDLLVNAIEDRIDVDEFDAMKEREDSDIERLEKIIEKLSKR